MTDKVHAMLDIETLGQGSNAFIVQIAITTFKLNDSEYYGESLIQNIDVWRAQAGSEIDNATVQWWQGQSDNVRETVMSGTDNLSNALYNLDLFFREHKIECLWANSPSFDCVIVENAIKRLALPNRFPKFWQWRDMRTVVALANDMGANLPKLHNTHDAAQDVEKQVALLKKALDFINQ